MGAFGRRLQVWPKRRQIAGPKWNDGVCRRAIMADWVASFQLSEATPLLANTFVPFYTLIQYIGSKGKRNVGKFPHTQLMDLLRCFDRKMQVFIRENNAKHAKHART